jgi:hypothetical protein
VRRDTIPRAAQKPATRLASVDSLVECSPVAAPLRKKPLARRRRAVAPAKKPAKKLATKAATAVVVPKPVEKALVKPRRPLVRHVKRRTPKAKTALPARSTTIVMCRPVHPLAPLSLGTPTEQSVIPVPQLAPVTPAAPIVEEGPPLIVSTAPGIPVAAAGGGRSWLPWAIIPAIFIPFIHSGTTHHGSTPTDTTTTPPIVPPPIVPPTTTPEPGTLVMLGTGLLGLAGVMKRKRKRQG